MSDVLFYHLERSSQTVVLTQLLEKCLERGWRVCVQTQNAEQSDALNGDLWTFRDDSFLPHGVAADGHETLQPVFITHTGENPNGAAVRFCLSGAGPVDNTPYERIIYFIDGHDNAAVASARSLWRDATDGGHAVSYWRQEESGQWRQQEPPS